MIVVKALPNEEDESDKDLSFELEIAQVDKSFIELQLSFTSPIDVSPQDVLEVTLNFEEFEPGLPNQQVEIYMTKQLVEGSTTDAIQALATTSALVAGSAAGSSAIINTLISGSLAQLWGMINSMQILVHMSVLNVDFPMTA